MNLRYDDLDEDDERGRLIYQDAYIEGREQLEAEYEFARQSRWYRRLVRWFFGLTLVRE